MEIYPLHLIDWYKGDHPRQYPKGTTRIVSNMCPRKSRIPGVEYIVFFTLQYFIKEYLIDLWNKKFFNVERWQAVRSFKRRIDTSLGKDAIPVEHIYKLYDLGYLPLQIMALPEGSSVPMRVSPFLVWNTVPEMFWLTNNIETILSASLWQGCTSATLAKEYKKIFNEGAMETVGNTDFTQWQGHDFSFRGMSSLETACLSGAGHLLSFTGTDTVPAIDFLEEYYNANADLELIGGSVPATEHSVMCAGGQETEIDTFRRLLSIYPEGILSVVSDTWDYWNVLTETAVELKEQIMSRNGKLVFRPDSSKKTPYEIICGDEEAEPGTPEYKGSILILWEIFGGTYSKTGYKILDSHVGLIYGDSITPTLARKVNNRLKQMGFATINWVAGIGSFTYQYNTRDTQGWAMKATYVEINGEGKEIFKDPKTDSGMKKSAKGLIAVYKDETGKYYQRDQATWDDVMNCEYKCVFKDGNLLINQSLAEIRHRVKNSL